MPLSFERDDGSFEVHPDELFVSIGSFLALKHFNDRSPAVLPNLPALLQDCDIQLTTEFYDSQFNPLVVSRAVSEMLGRKSHSLETPYPAAIVGGAYSSDAKPSAILSGIYGVPFVASSASSSDLENRGTYPTFARVTPTDEGRATIMVEHFASLNVTHIGVIYVRDEFGVNYARFIRREAEKRNIVVVTASVDPDLDVDGQDRSVKVAVEELQKSKLKYFFAIPYLAGNDEDVLREAYRGGIAGPGFAWFMTDSGLGESEFDSDDREIIGAINGLGILDMQPEVSSTAEVTLMEFQFDTRLQEEFVASLKNVDKQLFVDYNLTEEVPLFSFWIGLTYDALILPAYAACSIDKEFFTGEELFKAISRTEFLGATGPIQLSSDTQTRDPVSVTFGLKNVFIDESASVNGTVRFQSRISTIFHSRDGIFSGHVNPYIYSDNSTIPPLSLPPVEVTTKLISDGSRILGLILCGLVIVIAMGWMAFVFFHRKAKYIRGSQPPFLCMLCIGVIVMAASIIPMSLQGGVPTTGLNVVCMSQLWLLSAGFTTTFSALFCKIWRLYKLVTSSMRFKRIQVRIQDVLYPFAILLTLNFSVLTVWSVVDPLVWVITDERSYDAFGRPVVSSGACASSSQSNEIIFYCLLGLLNFAALGCANWQSYRSRKLPTEFNESRNIMLSMMLMTEAAVLGLPVLFLVGDDPSSFFMVRSILISIVALGVMMPIFVPMMSLRNQKRMSKSRLVSSKRLHDSNSAMNSSGNHLSLRSTELSGIQGVLNDFHPSLRGSELTGSNRVLNDSLQLLRSSQVSWSDPVLNESLPSPRHVEITEPNHVSTESRPSRNASVE